MEKLDVKKYNISLLTVGTPVEIGKGSEYNLKVAYNRKDFIIQTPMCTVLEIDTKCKKAYMKISFRISKNFNHFQFFCGLNQQILDVLEEHSQSPDYEILKKVEDDPESETDNPIEDAFKTSSERSNDSDIILTVKLNKETSYFDKEKSEISGLEIKPGDKVVGLIKNKGVFVDQYRANFCWTAKEILKFK